VKHIRPKRQVRGKREQLAIEQEEFAERKKAHSYIKMLAKSVRVDIKEALEMTRAAGLQVP